VMSLDFTTATKHVPVRKVIPIANDGQLVSLVQQAHRFHDPTPSDIEQQLYWRDKLVAPLCLCNAVLFGGGDLLQFEADFQTMWHHQFSGEECCTKCRRAKN
jgi:hypothetical protein